MSRPSVTSRVCAPYSCDVDRALPGELTAHVHCRTCGRSVQFDARRIPPAPLTERDRQRFWCMKCGGRGADVTIAWIILPTQRGAESAMGTVFYLGESRRVDWMKLPELTD